MAEWFDWMVENPNEATMAAGAAALALLALIVGGRLAFAALGRRVMVGRRLRKKVAKESPWASMDERVAYGLRPVRRPWWKAWGRA